MVNTFIPFASFRKSARVLDLPRLRKQIVEAYQILDYLYIADILIAYYKLPPIPTYNSKLEKTSPENQASHHTEVYARYRNYVKHVREQKTHFLLRRVYDTQPHIEVIDTAYGDSPAMYYRPDPSTRIHQEDGVRYVELTPGKAPKMWPSVPGETLPPKTTKHRSWYMIPESHFLLPDDKIVRYDNSFMSHPVILMWLGCKDALRYYIECMRDEYQSRTQGSDVWTPFNQFPPVPCPKPWWCHGKNIIMATHQISLLQKTKESVDPVMQKGYLVYQRKFAEYPDDLMEISDYYWPSGKVEDTISGDFSRVFDGVVQILSCSQQAMLDDLLNRGKHAYQI